MTESIEVERVATKASEIPKLTRALRCEIIKPLNVTWDEAGSLLRGQRVVMHHLMNPAVLCVLDDRRLEGRTIASPEYHAVKQELDSFKAWAAKNRDHSQRRLSEIDVGTGIMSAVAQIGVDAFQKWKKGHGKRTHP